MTGPGTSLSVVQVYDTWIGAGGLEGDIGVAMTAIAMAESSGDPTAVSRSNDYGLWQINAVHAAEFPRLWPRRFDPISNAKMALAISNGGQDVGPWCTAWVDPANCGHYLATPPQRDSPAGQLIPMVAAVVGDKSGSPGVEHYPPGFGAVHRPGERGWGRLQRIVGPTGTDWWHTQQAAIERARRI